MHGKSGTPIKVLRVLSGLQSCKRSDARQRASTRPPNRFAMASPVERAGFELSVPRERSFAYQRIEAAHYAASLKSDVVGAKAPSKTKTLLLD
jgi:hypothetical protein